ncbi:hypothetical protein SAMN05518866_11397 [Sphingobium sp. YR768]|jgi:hypothetical protein|nr:hypothetical protein SAMN05518866_11397 [Sphingobium sp. YR768]
MNIKPASVSVYVPYRGTIRTRIEKSSTWSDRDQEAGE